MNSAILYVIYFCIIISTMTTFLINNNNLHEALINSGISGVISFFLCLIFHYTYNKFRNKPNNNSYIK